MTDDNTEAWAKAAQKKSLFSPIAALLKRGSAVRKNEVPEASSENSVEEDIKKLKTGVGGAIAKTSKALTPVAARAKESVGKVDKTFWQKALRLFFVAFVLVILAFVVIGIVSYISRTVRKGGNGNGNGDGTSEVSITTTPTPAPFIPFKPSVYAEDAKVLELEENISVLERQLIQDNLRESKINPPNLDFNVKF